MAEESTIKFYDKESSQYSQKRYEGESVTYFQFIFKRRLSLFLCFSEKILNGKKNIDALEIGCADGVIIRKLLELYDSSFQTVVGTDISPGMVSHAKEITPNKKVSYYVRGSEPSTQYDFVFELGVHTYDFEKELSYVHDVLKEEGYFVYSVAGKNSIHAKIKLKGVDYVSDYKNYNEYEEVIGKYFTIVSAEVYGLFVPKLWAFPTLARFVQPIVESIFKNLFPNLFHENIYLLRKK